MSNKFTISYAGLDADDHALDMRKFGDALVGLDKVISAGLIAVADFREPKKGERFPLRIRAREPEEGTFHIVGELVPVAHGLYVSVLPIVHEVFHKKAGEIAWAWVSWVLKMAGGREHEADPHFTALMELTKEIHRGRIESEEANRRFLLEVLDRVLPQARHVVAPVGTSADTLTIWPGTPDEKTDQATEVDVPSAEAIRSKEKLKVGDMETFIVRVDGIIHHARQLKIEHPTEAGKYLTAQVRDPAFDDPSGVYMKAVASQGLLEVSAKPSRKEDGSLQALYILDARLPATS